MNQIAAALLIVCVLAPANFAQKQKKGPDDLGVSNPAKGVNFYSIQREMALGKEMAEDVERESELVNDVVITEYVNRLGQNLVRSSNAQVPLTIKIIDSDTVNALALPGGFMFVNTGLILRAESEAELAGVMSHEIAHVAARHGAKQATRREILSYATIPLIFAGGWAGFAIRQAANLAVPVAFLQFSRATERQADHLGLEYLYKAGYDPRAFVDFFEKIQSLERKRPGTISKLFSSHPTVGSRITSAQRVIQNELKPRSEYVVDTSEFQKVRARLATLEDRRNGIFQGDITRTLTMRSLGEIDQRGKSEDFSRPTLRRRD